jgi:hypothetical protein
MDSSSRASGLRDDRRRIATMELLTEYFNWWVVDELTGERQLTKFKLSRANAQRAFPGAKPDLQSKEVHNLTAPGELLADTRRTSEAAK